METGWIPRLRGMCGISDAAGAHDASARAGDMPFNYVDHSGGDTVVDRRSTEENYEVVDGLPQFVK